MRDLGVTKGFWWFFWLSMVLFMMAGWVSLRQSPKSVSDPTPPPALTLSEERDAIVKLEASLAGVPVALALAVSHVENTSGDSMAVSSAGAVGIMQVTPKLWQHAFESECGCGSLFRRQHNACVGVHVLKLQRQRHGSWEAALRAYHGSLQMPTVGRQYVAAVLEKALAQ